jgi:putative transcriptional regulator
MDDELFGDLVTGLNEMVAFEKGKLNEDVDRRVIHPRFETLQADSPLNEGGAYIASIRYDLKLSQADFAKILGVSTQTVSSWEQGLRKPNGAVAKLLTLIDNDPTRINELVELAL